MRLHLIFLFTIFCFGVSKIDKRQAPVYPQPHIVYHYIPPDLLPSREAREYYEFFGDPFVTKGKDVISVQRPFIKIRAPPGTIHVEEIPGSSLPLITLSDPFLIPPIYENPVGPDPPKKTGFVPKPSHIQTTTQANLVSSSNQSKVKPQFVLPYILKEPRPDHISSSNKLITDNESSPSDKREPQLNLNPFLSPPIFKPFLFIPPQSEFGPVFTPDSMSIQDKTKTRPVSTLSGASVNPVPNLAPPPGRPEKDSFPITMFSSSSETHFAPQMVSSLGLPFSKPMASPPGSFVKPQANTANNSGETVRQPFPFELFSPNRERNEPSRFVPQLEVSNRRPNLNSSTTFEDKQPNIASLPKKTVNESFPFRISLPINGNNTNVEVFPRQSTPKSTITSSTILEDPFLKILPSLGRLKFDSELIETLEKAAEFSERLSSQPHKPEIIFLPSNSSSGKFSEPRPNLRPPSDLLITGHLPRPLFSIPSFLPQNIPGFEVPTSNTSISFLN